MLTKEKVLKTITEMPDTFSVDDLLDRLVLLQKIENGIAQSDAGKTVSTEQAREALSKWLK
jgi:predicted transcriptional regulator